MTVQFWLNDQLVETDEPHGLLLLDFLRKRKRLVGTKEGCKEGDCGACSVMLGELKDGQVHYRPVTSCLVPLGEMHGRHVVTVEGVTPKGGLNPVQEAMVERGGSQCGFCTPGFIVSMSWYLMCGKGEPTLDGFKRAISGNLCRCTGYNSIKRASEDVVAQYGPGGQHANIWNASDRVVALADAGFIPSHFKGMAQKLADIDHSHAGSADDGNVVDFFIGGGTDLYVQRGEHIPDSTVAILNRYPEMRGIRVQDGWYHVGSLTTFEQFAQHPEIRKVIPKVDEWLWLIASLHLRNRATIAGNIVNASPIGDMSNLMLALDSELVLRAGDDERIVPMKSFYKGYKQFDKKPHEIVTEIRFPVPKSGTVVHFEKVSKRKALDIASVNSAAKMRISDAGVVEEMSLTAGGVAATPLWLKDTSAFLVGKAINTDTVRDALEVAMNEISPISDVRGSAEYKRLLTRQFIISHCMKLSPSTVDFQELA